MKWERYDAKYGPGGYEALLGRWVVGKTSWSISQKRGEPPYVANCYLPGIRDRFGPFDAEDGAKQKIEWAVGQWIAMAGLQQAQGETEERSDTGTAEQRDASLTLIKRLVQQLQSVSKDTEYQLHQVNVMHCTCPLCDGERFLEKLEAGQ